MPDFGFGSRFLREDDLYLIIYEIMKFVNFFNQIGKMSANIHKRNSKSDKAIKKSTIRLKIFAVKRKKVYNILE